MSARCGNEGAENSITFHYILFHPPDYLLPPHSGGDILHTVE
jgi:hypothetical protein